jgi:2-methylisocitrate lyase-like PEP mutase family enzyme
MSLRRRYRELIAAPGILVLPGVYDGLSARIAERAGFAALVAGGNAAIGSMLAGADIGQSNMRDYADHYARICGAVQIPVTVDADTGFGDVHNVRQTVRAFQAAGVAGLMISDQVFPNRCGYLAGKQVVPAEQMVAKIKAAVDARTDPDMVIIARTDAAGVTGLDDAIWRARLYLEAGADLGRPQGVDTPEAIGRVIAEVPCPFIAILSQAAGKRKLDIADLEALGVAGVTLPTISLFAAVRNIERVLGELRRTNSLEGLEGDLVPLDAYYDLVGLDRDQALEESFHDAARTLVAAAEAARGDGQDRPRAGDRHGARDAGSATPAREAAAP